jgi:AcrR family transcriptional regulator
MAVRRGTVSRKPPGKKAAPDRASWGSISRQQVIEAALEAIHDDDFEQMTIRSLAADLGVAPMSLYRHIRNKDDLLNEVAEELLNRAWHPPSRARSWRTWITEAANGLRELLVNEPAVLHVYMRHPVVSPTAVKRMDAMIAEFRRAGFTPTGATDAYAAIHTYTIGFAFLEASRSNWTSVDLQEDRLTAQLANFTTPRQFDRGLGYLLDGLEGRAR